MDCFALFLAVEDRVVRMDVFDFTWIDLRVVRVVVGIVVGRTVIGGEEGLSGGSVILTEGGDEAAGGGVGDWGHRLR